MRAHARGVALGVVLAACIAAPETAAGALRADRVVPRAAVAGAAVELRGSGLAERGTSVRVDGRRAKVLSRRARRLRFVVPRVKPGARTLVVRRGRRSDAARMRVRRPFRGRVGLKVDRGRARGRTIGPAGGSIGARGRDGTRYELTVPPGALAADRAITIAPVRSFDGLPLTGGGARGVRLAPDGLRFATPATLTIRARRAFPRKSVGFSSGGGFAVGRATGSGRIRALRIEHFSGAGAAGVTPADFAAVVGPLVTGLGTLTETQIEQLIVLVDRWEALFPPDFCNTQPVCGQAVQKGLDSIESLVRGRCDDGFVEPSLTVLRDIVRLEGLRRALGEGTDPSDECRDGIARRVANRSRAAVCGPGADPLSRYAAIGDLPPAERPGGSLDGDGEITQLEFLLFLIGPLATVGLDAEASQARDCALGALEALPAAGRARCDADPAGSERDLRSALAYAQTLQRVLQPYIDALDFCGVAVAVVPSAVSLETGATQQFAAAVSGVLDTSNNADVTWNASGGTIDAGGFYTAPATAGVFTVTAASVLNPARTTTATVTVGSCAAPKAGAFPGADGRIAFQAGLPDSAGLNDWEIYSIEPDGSDLRNLTNFVDPDGTVYSSDRSPAWSPDGTRIAFETTRESDETPSNTEIYVMGADGGAPANLTRTASRDATGVNYHPAWSPDGARIAFARLGEVVDPGNGVWVMNADGSDQTQIVPAFGAGEPAWSPDGTRIAYLRGTIHTVRPDGSGDTPLGLAGRFPEWSPDGGRIAYLRQGDLFVAGADGTGEAQRTFTGTAPLGRMAWSPDGRRIAFAASTSPEIYDVWIVDLGTGGLSNLTSFTRPGASVENVSWQSVAC